MNTIDSITEALVTDIAPCFVLDFSGKQPRNQEGLVELCFALSLLYLKISGLK